MRYNLISNCSDFTSPWPYMANVGGRLQSPKPTQYIIASSREVYPRPHPASNTWRIVLSAPGLERRQETASTTISFLQGEADEVQFGTRLGEVSSSVALLEAGLKSAVIS